MRRILPRSRPKATRADVLKYAADAGLDLNACPILIIGVRGYYLRTMGKPYQNDRNLYDDAMFLVTADDFVSYNCNVDPSKYRKGIASLVPGIYKAVKWRHKGKYAALQIVEDRVSRDGQTRVDVGRHGINFHYGGDDDTWSGGCLTFPRAQYWQFQGAVYELMDELKQRAVTFLLVEND